MKSTFAMFAQSAGWIQPRLILSSLARKTNTAFSPLLRTDTMTGRGSSPVAHGCDLAAKRESCSSGFSTRPQQSTSAGGDDGNISLCHPRVRPANNLAAEAAGGGVDSTNNNTHQHGDDDDGGSGDDDWFKIVDVDIAESAGQGGGGGATPTTPSTTTPTGTKTAAPPAAAIQAAGAGKKNQRLPAFNFSFAMGGWLMFYTFGVAKCLLDHGLHNVRPTEQSVIGSSAGSLAAAALVLEADIDKIVEQAKTSFIPRAHAARFFGFVYGMFYIGQFLLESLLACLPVERVSRNTSPPGRLTVVLSSVLGWKSIRAKEFRDGEDLIDALRCSCACFPLVLPHVFRGKRCFDGVFSEGPSAPSLDEEEAGGLKTVTISPLYASTASIRPSRYVPLSWIALPPNDPGAIDWLYDLGYRDALFWMANEGIEHTCSHMSRLSRFSSISNGCAPDSTMAKSSVVDAGASALRSRNSSSSSSEGDDDENDERLAAERATTPSNPTTSASSRRSTSNSSGNTSLEETASVSSVAPPGNSSSGLDEGNNGNESLSSSSPLPSPSSSSSSAVAARRGNEGGLGLTSTTAREDGKGRRNGGGQERQFYVRSSFTLSGCRMRPRRERHAELDAPRFVPSLEKFVGHGSYHALADSLFCVFFNVVWRPAAALLLCAELVTSLLLASSRAFAKDLRPLLWWLLPTLLLGEAALEHRPTATEGIAAAVAVAAVVAAAASREGAPGKESWREARRSARALVDFRCVLVSTLLLPWGRGGRGEGREGGAGVKSEALAGSFMYRAVSFFM